VRDIKIIPERWIKVMENKELLLKISEKTGYFITDSSN
jgi:hypothetical protein